MSTAGMERLVAWATRSERRVSHHTSAAAAKYAATFPKLELLSIDKDFGGWKNAQAIYFADGGVFDQIYVPGR